MTTVIRHWFTPHSSNNFRAKLLHSSSLLAVIGLVLAFNVFVRLLDSSPLHILGFTSTITVDEVVAKTNVERVAAGLPPLVVNTTLEDAARRKAANMFAEDYWAHNSPSGLSPWHWFTQAGYQYTHAGENLAKDFGSTERMMNAWMNSPTHKDNIVSAKYEDIGVAVVPGTLQGHETVLVVQLFGSQREVGAVPKVAEVTTATPHPAVAGAKLGGSDIPVPTPAPTVIPMAVVSASQAPSQAPSSPSINTLSLEKSVGLATTLLLMLALVLDLVIANNQALSRRVGKNWAHLIFINVILILVTIVQAGTILPEGINVF